MLFGAMASETTWLTHILYMTTDCHYVMVQLSHLSAAPQRDDISLSLASKWYQCSHRIHQVVILAVAPCQPSLVTPCLAIGTVSGCTGWMLKATSCGRDWPFALIFSCEMSPSASAPGAASRGGYSYCQTAVPPVMAWQRPAVHRSEGRWAHFCSEGCIEGCLVDALWDLQDWSTAVTVWQICPNCFAVLTILIFVWWYDTCYCILSRQSKNDVSAAWCAHGNC